MKHEPYSISKFNQQYFKLLSVSEFKLKRELTHDEENNLFIKCLRYAMGMEPFLTGQKSVLQPKYYLKK